jgi:hypothetical protein
MSADIAMLYFGLEKELNLIHQSEIIELFTILAVKEARFPYRLLEPDLNLLIPYLNSMAMLVPKNS